MKKSKIKARFVEDDVLARDNEKYINSIFGMKKTIIIVEATIQYKGDTFFLFIPSGLSEEEFLLNLQEQFL